MQVKRTAPHRAAPAGGGRAAKKGAKGAAKATPEAVDEAAPAKEARARRAGELPAQAPGAADEAVAPPKARRARSSGRPPETPMAAELALSIVEMGEALGSLASRGRGARGRGVGERARNTRIAAQAFVDDAGVEPAEPKR